jgi:hypothetical protein
MTNIIAALTAKFCQRSSRCLYPFNPCIFAVPHVHEDASMLHQLIEFESRGKLKKAHLSIPHITRKIRGKKS